MAETLTATGSTLSGVRPVLDNSGNLTALYVDIALSYVGTEGTLCGATKTFNAWDVLSPTQKTNMQDIQNALMGYILSTYFA